MKEAEIHGQSIEVRSSQPYLRIALLKFGRKIRDGPTDGLTKRLTESRALDYNAEKKFTYDGQSDPCQNY